MTIEIRYHRPVVASIVIPVDGRTGQLATGQLRVADDQLDLGNLLNSHGVLVGDVLQFISDVDELSGNADAEVIAANVGEFEITDITGNLATFATSYVYEANSEEGRFFEFKILRRSPYRKFTFERSDQTSFAPIVTTIPPTTLIPTLPTALYENGVLVDVTVTNPSGEVTVVTWPRGMLTFTPLGFSRWSCEMAIDVDGVIELLLDDGAIDFRLTNFNVLQDAPLAFFEDDPTRFGQKVTQDLAAVRRMAGAFWLEGEPPGVAVEIATVEFDRQRFVAGATNEVIFRVRTADNRFQPRLDGAVIFFEMRSSVDQSVVLLKECTNINAGVAMLTLTPSESVEGLYSGRLIIYMGGVPEKTLRTQLIQVAIRS